MKKALTCKPSPALTIQYCNLAKLHPLGVYIVLEPCAQFCVALLCGSFIVLELASFPGLLRLQFLIACSMQKRREKAWGISSRDPWHDRQMSSRLLSTAK